MARRVNRDPKTVVGYVRVSTDDQNLGPDAQRAALERWCSANSFELVAVFEDRGVSGSAPLEKRPGLIQAIESMDGIGAATLLVAKRDRLARDTVVAAMVERLVERGGGRVQSADGAGNGESPEAQMMRGIIDIFAQYERAIIRARTKAALAVKKAKGERTGGALPFGYAVAEDGKRLIENPSESAIIERIKALASEGKAPGAIAILLNSEGVQARGSRWHRTTVCRVLSRLNS